MKIPRINEGTVFFLPAIKIKAYLEDHPIYISKWLITMVSFRPLSRVVGPLPNGRTPWLINGGDPNYLLSGMILQVSNTQASSIHQTGISRQISSRPFTAGWEFPEMVVIERESLQNALIIQV